MSNASVKCMVLGIICEVFGFPLSPTSIADLQVAYNTAYCPEGINKTKVYTNFKPIFVFSIYEKGRGANLHCSTLRRALLSKGINRNEVF